MKLLSPYKVIFMILVAVGFAMAGFVPSTKPKPPLPASAKRQAIVVTTTPAPSGAVAAQPIGSEKTIQMGILPLATVTPTGTGVRTTPGPGGCTPDNDGDGYCPPQDCDDNDPLVHPNNPAWFNRPRSNGSWDYDCDAVITTSLSPYLYNGKISTNPPGCCGVAKKGPRVPSCAPPASTVYYINSSNLRNVDSTLCGANVYVTFGNQDYVYADAACSSLLGYEAPPNPVQILCK